MGHVRFKDELSDEDGSEQYVVLMKDKRTICRTRCKNPPGKMPGVWSISRFEHQSRIKIRSGTPPFSLYCAAETDHQKFEWGKFFNFLRDNARVAICRVGIHDFIAIAPVQGTDFTHLAVDFIVLEDAALHGSEMHGAAGIASRTPLMSRENVGDSYNPVSILQPSAKPEKVCSQSRTSFSTEAALSNSGMVEELKIRSYRSPEKAENTASSVKNYVRTDPSYLKTLGHTHSGWIFGAIAELVDNSRDAKATIFKISIDPIYLKTTGEEIPMLSIIDDGCGMGHQEIFQMISFGHKQPDADDPDRIGRFGIGFKTGAMRLGKDALVLTQTKNSRSIAFLSQTLNEGKENLEIPIISYRKTGQLMELDTSIQDEILAKFNLKTIKKFSPFDKYFIGEKSGLFCEKGTGTQIYIWNLEKWGSDYCLRSEDGLSGGSSFHQGDIVIHSKRIRARPGQMTQEVPLDYSLRAYLQVIFFDPRMKMYVQGAQVKSCSLARSLNKTDVEDGIILGKQVQLILGRSQIEWERGNCGVFLYWHGRLIEAYKRVGSIIHNGDKGHGIIGVIDVTDLMSDDSGLFLVHNSKQGFLDCEAYAELEMWLGQKVDEYIDKHVDKVEVKKGSRLYEPDNDWVQCDKCRKWRRLPPKFSIKDLPNDWFCYLTPFNGSCEMKEEKVKPGVITISSKRSRCGSKEDPVNSPDRPSKRSNEASKDMNIGNASNLELDDHLNQHPRRLRRGPARGARKF